VPTFIILISRSQEPQQYMYIYMLDNTSLMMNKSPWAAGVPSLWKPVLHRLERHHVMVVPLNVLTWFFCGSVFQSEGFYSVNRWSV
jgi:hypothetical protein